MLHFWEIDGKSFKSTNGENEKFLLWVLFIELYEF